MIVAMFTKNITEYGQKRNKSRHINIRKECLTVYVDEADDKALDVALADAGNAYRGFFPVHGSDAELKAEQHRRAALFEERGEPGAAEVMRNLLDPEYLLANDLILLGSPETVARKLRGYASEGMFNTFFGEFNFGSLGEDDLMHRSRR